MARKVPIGTTVPPIKSAANESNGTRRKAATANVTLRLIVISKL